MRLLSTPVDLPAIKLGPPPQTRTETVMILSHVPLPIGLEEDGAETL